MNDLIKREDAIKAMEQRYEDILRTFKRKVKIGEKAIVSDMIGCVKNLPSADRSQGEWIDSQGRPMRLYESYSANCSACGEWSEYLTEYCPHCGARMKGADNETD